MQFIILYQENTQFQIDVDVEPIAYQQYNM
jgi:hypothetical protein